MFDSSGGGKAGSCRIERTGEVVRIDTDSAVVSFGGKTVSIPAAKLDKGIRLGDRVVWTGSVWRRSEPLVPLDDAETDLSETE
ncbi:hypothetical protein [Paenibacillus arenilitoris]|uniref:Uncharacterized protein n=1 Tax=Paenibacillus arenilitoris TaxID=2772299 RepID=A0A927H5S1_9BACL|nr:hypothetical protein [Paenibacillus arenilitoris]MBD2869761.1 hypothetical protein [Paenibacillus arenilitoris]